MRLWTGVRLAVRPRSWRNIVVFSRVTADGRLAQRSVQAHHLVLVRWEQDVTHDAHLKALSDYKDILDVLLSDVAAAMQENTSKDTPEQRRRYIRNGIAMVEGVTAAVRRVALADVEAGVANFSPGEVAILTGKIYELDDQGGVRSLPHSQKLTRLVRFSFDVQAKTYGVPFALEVGGDGWRCFRSTVLVRNRLVHPKVPNDLVVTDEEIREGLIAFQWFVDECLRVGEVVSASLRESRPTDPEIETQEQ